MADKVYLYPSLGGAFSMNRYLNGVIEGLKKNGVNYEVICPRGEGLISKYVRFPFEVFKNRKQGGKHLIISERYAYLLFFFGKANTVIVCHDLHTLYKEANTGKINTRIYKFFLKALTRSKRIVCVSKHTKNDLMKFLPKLSSSKIDVVYNGIEDFWSLPVSINYSWPWPGDFLHNKNILLSVGTDAWYKNNECTIRVLEKLPSDFCLLRIGEFNKANTQLIIDLDLQERVIIRTEISDNDLKYAYNNAHAFIFPSISEGFGWPAVEASLSKCPVITTGNGAIREVFGTKHQFFNSISEMKESILKSKFHDQSRAVNLKKWEEQVKELVGV